MSRALAHLAPGQEARIAALHAGEALQHRLAALGFRIGKPVQLVRRAAFNGPLHVRIDSTDVIIRCADAACVELCALTEECPCPLPPNTLAPDGLAS